MATRGAYGTTEQNARRILDSLAAKGLIDPRKNYAQDDREDTALNQLQGLMTLAKQTAQFHEEDGRALGDASLFNALAAEGIAPNAELAGTTVTRDGKTYRMTDYASTSLPGLSPDWFIDDPNYGQLMDTQAYAAAHPSGENSLTLPILAASGLAAGAGALGYGSMAGGAEGLGGLASGGGVGGGAGGVAAAAPSGASAGTLAQFGGAAPMFGAEAALGGSGLGAATGGAGTGLAGLGGAGAGLGGLGALGSAAGGLGGGSGNSTFGIPNNILSGAAQGIGGLLAANAQGDAYEDVYNQQSAIGAPYRDLLLGSYQPSFDLASQPGYGDAFKRAADISSRSYSARMGNPADNPTAQAGILNDVWSQNYLPALSNYRGGLMQGGGMGLNTSGQASMAQAGTSGSGWEAIGAGIGTALTPQNSWEELLKKYGGGSGNNGGFNLNIGGMPYGGR